MEGDALNNAAQSDIIVGTQEREVRMPKNRQTPVSVRMPVEMERDFEKWRKKFGQTKSAFALLCIAAGMKSVIRGVSPESAVDADQMARVLTLIAKHEGVNLKKVLLREKARP